VTSIHGRGGNRLSTSRVLKFVTGGCEALLGIPFIGGLIVVSSLWTALGVMLVLHIITLIISSNEKTETGPSILGIVTSCIAWIPIVGMIMHIITAIVLLATASKDPRPPADRSM
jgi:predicted branched-subunit amino acid permease